MADTDYYGEQTYGYDPEPEALASAGGNFGTLVNWAGALVSLGLVVGMGIWAWQLMVRDVSDVPVIRALEGPMRVAPNDPGGAQADHMGLAVNRIAEGEEAAPVPDQLVLAPPPVELQELHLANVSASASETATAPVATASARAPAPDAGASTETAALLDRLLAGSERLEPLSPAEPVEVGPPADFGVDVDVPAADAPALGDPDAPLAAAILPASVPGVARSPRPAVRPGDRVVLAAAPAADASGAAVEELSPASLADGTRLVQLGAFNSPDLARAEWTRLATAFPDFFVGRARVIEEASSGGQTFYRLRGHGFEDLSASRRFCAALDAQGVDCIPVTVR